MTTLHDFRVTIGACLSDTSYSDSHKHASICTTNTTCNMLMSMLMTTLHDFRVPVSVLMMH
jgi:hypothetical protein